MLTVINDKTIMTRLEAKKKYETNYIGFVITDDKDDYDPDNTLGYVTHIVDSYLEQFNIPRYTTDGMYISKMSGWGVGGTEIGGVYLVQ